MKGTNARLNQYVRDWIADYRSRKDYSMDRMSEELQEDSRSYSDQEKGKIGFSGNTVCRMLLCLSDEEVLGFVNGLKEFVWDEEFKEVMGRPRKEENQIS